MPRIADISAIDPDTDVIVLGLYIQGAAMLRHLARRGYRVCAMTDYDADLGLSSRHGTKILCPPVLSEFDSWLAMMEAIAARCGKRPALIPTVDRYVLALDRAAPRLQDKFRFHGFGSGLRTALTGKRRTFELAEEKGFPMPRTRPAGNREELLRFCTEVAWPALIKPNHSFNWHAEGAVAHLGSGERKVLTADSPEALCAAFEALRPYSPDAIVQELIPGPDRDLIYWAGFVGADGRVRGRFVGRKLRVMPAHFGSASFVQLVDMPDVEAACEHWLGGLGYRGLAGIELKIDERDGRAKLIEVNPRFGLWEDIGIPAGVDLPQEAVAALFGEEPPVKRTARFDQKWVHFERDLRALRQYRREGALGILPWLRSLAPPIIVNDFPWIGDFPYARANLWRLLRGITGASLHRGKAKPKAASSAHA